MPPNTLVRVFFIVIVSIVINKISTESGTILPNALVSLIEKSYVGRTTVLNLFFYCEDDIRRIQFFYDLVDFTLRKLDTVSVRIGVQEELYTDSQRHYIVVAVDSVTSMDKMFHEITEMHFNIEGKVLIVLKTFDGHYYRNMLKIFELCWDNGIVDVNILVEPIPDDVSIFTYFPFTKTSCAIVAPVLWNRFKNSSWENENLFPSKLSNLQGCPLLCATWEDDPYLKILHNERNHMVFDGIEGKLLEFFATKMNFTITFKILTEEQIARTLEDKGEVFDELFWEGVEFVIGALHYRPTFYDDFFKPTNGYYLSDYNIIISSKREKLPPIAKLLYPFTASVWFYVMLYFGVGAAVAFGAKWLADNIRDFILGSMNHIALYNMFYTALGGGVYRIPGRNFARFLLCTWMLLWLVLRSGYQSALFNFIRTDISMPPPNNIDEVLRENFKIYLTPAVYKTLDKIPSIQAASQLLNGSEVENFPMLLNDRNGRVAILVPYEYFGFYKKNHIDEISEYYVVKEHVFTQQLSLYLRKDSYLVLPFNKLILEYYSNGLTRKWERAFIALKNENRKTETEPIKVMTLGEVYGAVDIYLLGITFGIIVFVGEIVVFRFQKNYPKFLKKVFRRNIKYNLK